MISDEPKSLRIIYCTTLHIYFMGMYVSNITSKHDPQTIFYISTFLGICCIVLKNKTKNLHQILSVISSF